MPPVVKTRAYLGYDSDYFYVAMYNYDPHPGEIRASFTDRDSVLSDQDFVQFDLDTKNQEKASFIFRVNPRGVPADAIFSEATGVDDFSPDFSFEVQARIVEDGWIAEFRILLSSLRYSDAPLQTWGATGPAGDGRAGALRLGLLAHEQWDPNCSSPSSKTPLERTSDTDPPRTHFHSISQPEAKRPLRRSRSLTNER